MANANDEQFMALMKNRVAEIQDYVRILLKPQ
jgi:hypothetical protein